MNTLIIIAIFLIWSVYGVYHFAHSVNSLNDGSDEYLSKWWTVLCCGPIVIGYVINVILVMLFSVVLIMINKDLQDAHLEPKKETDHD